LIGFGGFIPTYWAKIAAGTFTGQPILHIHGMLFFSWTVFFFLQTTLVAMAQTPYHRNWGIAGVSLATAMACTVVLAAINSIKGAEAINLGDAARHFTIVPFSGLVLFVALSTAAAVNNRRPEVHKRLMVLGMIPLMHAATARVFQAFQSPPGGVGPPPVLVEVERLWGSKSGTPKGDRLDVLATLIDAYETEHYPMESPDPVEAIKFRMEQQRLSRKDLEPFIGTRTRVAEVLNRKRSLSIRMIRRLHEHLGISAEVLIRPSQKNKAA
jgi:HTH-type transcriptional regulator/antitoxin HigA